MATPTIQRRRLGIALKQAREEAGKTQDEAAERIDAAASKISRIELGQSGLKLTDLGILLDFYGVPEKQRKWMKDMARAGRQRGRWSGYRSVIPDWFRPFIDLESDASEIRRYQAEVVPGPLQIEPYIRITAAYFRHLNVVVGRRGTDEEEIDRQVTVRLQRQAVLEQSDSRFTFILSESALRRNVGGAAVMREQLRHLAEVATRPNVQLQVLPFDAQTYEPASFSFVILRFEKDAQSDVVYLEDFTDAAYVDRPEDVQAYTAVWNRLQAAALGPAESRHLILRVAGEEQ